MIAVISRVWRILILAVFGLLCLLAVADTHISTKKLAEIKSHYGVAAYQRVQDWIKILGLPRNIPEKDKLLKVNQFFNQVHFVSDQEHWHQKDYWATPLETLISNGGDCEDFSVAKYFTLTELGVDMKKLRLTYVKSLTLNQAHMVLSYFPDDHGEPLILDNLIPEIKPADERSDLLPVYSFNGKELWISKEKSEGNWVAVGKSSRIRLWENLLNKYSDEMIQKNNNKHISKNSDTTEGVQHEPL